MRHLREKAELLHDAQQRAVVKNSFAIFICFEICSDLISRVMSGAPCFYAALKLLQTEMLCKNTLHLLGLQLCVEVQTV